MADELLLVQKDRIRLLHSPACAATAAPVVTTEPAKPSAVSAAAPEKFAQPLSPPAASAAAPKTEASRQEGAAVAEETLRVNTQLLETLMNLTGELVLSRNQLRAAIAQNDQRALSMADQRLNLVTSELQEAVMRTRLQPVGNVFAKFPRVVRDMAAALNKEIQLDIRGKDVALDRSLIEGLSDPLTHMVRNAVDHGIESPEERMRAGKSRTGTMRIEARHEAGQVVVEVADDGKGIDPAKVAAAAQRKELITAEKLRGMSEQDALALIFLPGLTTAEKVTDVSGRGVGMDVAKTNLDRLGGKIEIKSEIGKGTLFCIKLPLTLSIIPSLIVSVEEERFAIPQINVEELLRVPPEEVKRRIEVVGDAEVLLLRDRIIPLVRFDALLGIVSTYVDPASNIREIDRRKNCADRRSPRHGCTDSNERAPADELDKAVRSDGRRRNRRKGRSYVRLGFFAGARKGRGSGGRAVRRCLFAAVIS